jgi:hypothetical protein
VHPVAWLAPWFDVAWAECSGWHEDALMACLNGPVGVADREVHPTELVYSRSLTGMITATVMNRWHVGF